MTELAPVKYEPLVFIPIPDSKELHGELAWKQWDQAVRELDKFNSGVPASPSRSTFQPAVSTSIANDGDARG
jgi:hypothetical protein